MPSDIKTNDASAGQVSRASKQVQKKKENPSTRKNSKKMVMFMSDHAQKVSGRKFSPMFFHCSMLLKRHADKFKKRRSLRKPSNIFCLIACPSSKTRLLTLEIKLSQWLASKTKGVVKLSDLWPPTTIPIPKLLFWFMLGYVPANLEKIANEHHKIFSSSSLLLDNLIGFIQQSVKHILKNKKLKDIEHFQREHQ